MTSHHSLDKAKICDSIGARLKELSEPQFAQFSSALIPNLSRPLIGVRIPLLRAYAKALAREDWRAVLDGDWCPATFEEVLLRGFLIGYARMPWEERWERIRGFVPYIDNWSVCDSCCCTFKDIRKHREEVWDELAACLRSEKEFEQRFAVIMMMDHFLTDDFIDRVLSAWRNTAVAGYYVEMAIGWGLSVSVLHYPEKTMVLLRDEHWSVVCRKKACQKILESHRPSEALRREIIELKSKFR